MELDNNKSEKKNSRNIYIDSACGILLIHMIIGHCCQWAGSNATTLYYKYTFCLGFFMPWFFYKAGIFYKTRPLKNVLIRSTKRLIVPFVIFSIIGTILLWIYEICGIEIGTIKGPAHIVLIIAGSVPGNMALWFLLSLFGCIVIYTCFQKIKAITPYGGGITLSYSQLR